MEEKIAQWAVAIFVAGYTAAIAYFVVHDMFSQSDEAIQTVVMANVMIIGIALAIHTVRKR